MSPSWYARNHIAARGAAEAEQIIRQHNLVLPLSLAFDPTVTEFAKIVWGYLAWARNGYQRRSVQQADIAHALSAKTDGVRHAIRALRRAGYLDVDREASGNSYILYSSPEEKARRQAAIRRLSQPERMWRVSAPRTRPRSPQRATMRLKRKHRESLSIR